MTTNVNTLRTHGKYVLCNAKHAGCTFKMKGRLREDLLPGRHLKLPRLQNICHYSNAQLVLDHRDLECSSSSIYLSFIAHITNMYCRSTVKTEITGPYSRISSLITYDNTHYSNQAFYSYYIPPPQKKRSGAEHPGFFFFLPFFNMGLKTWNVFDQLHCLINTPLN